MAAIQPMEIKFTGLIRGDLLDVTFDCVHNLTGMDGKTLYAEVRRGQDTPIILAFAELDESLLKTVISDTKFSLQFVKSAVDMQVKPALYQIAVIMGTAPAYPDKQTIIEGTFHVISEIAKIPID